MAALQPYPAYRDSGVEWLDEVPEHWEVRRLGTVTDMRVSNVDEHIDQGEQRIRLCNDLDVHHFKRYFYKPEPMRSLKEIRPDVLAVETETQGLLDEILGKRRAVW